MTTTAPLPAEDLAAAWITPAEFRALAPSQRRRATLAFVAEHRTRWDQESWANPEHPCGTSHCFGGWATVLGGAKTIDPDRLLEQGEAADWWIEPEPGDESGSIVLLEVHDDRYADDGTAWIDASTPYARAANLLELTSLQAAYLFRGVNDINGLRVLVCAINAGIADENRLSACYVAALHLDPDLQLNDFGARAIVDRVLNA